MQPSPADTTAVEYTERLSNLEGAWWKRVFDVQLPYRWHIKSLKLGRVLDVGCGIGRNLYYLDPGSVGIDHNPHSLDMARKRGCVVFGPQDFLESQFARSATFDSMLVAHVLEHLNSDDAAKLIKTYLPYLRAGARIVVITPQEAGYRSDPTHVQFVDHNAASAILEAAGLQIGRCYSFPFPRLAGRFFKYNEFVTIAVLTD